MLASKNRFHRRNHVNRVYKSGRSLRGGDISLRYRVESTADHKKIAVVVSKKVAKSAVIRNRIRRRVFEAVRRNLDAAPAGFEGIFSVFSDRVATMPAAELDAEIANFLRKATH